MKNPTWPVLLATSGFVLAGVIGCATLEENTSEYRSGWRTGWVKEVSTDYDSTPNPKEEACFPAGSLETIGKYKWVTVEYITVRLRKRQVRVVPSGATIKVGQKVRLNTLDCSQPLVLEGIRMEVR